MFSDNEIGQVRSLLDSIGQALIFTHKNPDGDAIGTSCGLAFFLKARGIETQVVVPNQYPDFLKWMPGKEDILVYEEQPKLVQNAVDRTEAIFILDLNQLSRMDEGLASIVAKAKQPKVLIDHHEDPSPCADIMLSRPGSSSTAEMVYQLVGALGQVSMLGVDAATCLYTGIMTDTGSFRYSSTKQSTHNAAAALLALGVEPSYVQQQVENNYSLGRLKLLGYALSEKLELLKEERTAYMSLTSEELKQFYFKKGDTEGLVNYGLNLENVVRAVLFVQQDSLIKISFRSIGSHRVDLLAKEYFSGGGHKNAAGGRWEGTMDEALARFRKVLPKYLIEHA